MEMTFFEEAAIYYIKFHYSIYAKEIGKHFPVKVLISSSVNKKAQYNQEA